MKILVTGGAGFIGSCFVRLALKVPAFDTSGFEIANLDKLTYAGNLENLAPVADNARYRFIKGDICDTGLVNQILDSFRPDAVVNFATESHVDRSIFSPLPVFETNLRGTFTLLEAVRSKGIGRPGKSGSLIQYVADRPGHDRRYALSSAKLTRETGWAPQMHFETGLAATVDWV